MSPCHADPARRLRRLAACLVLAAAAATAQAHPFHASYAEADYRPASGRLELAVRLFTDDAEAALSRQAGRQLKVAGTPAAEFDTALLAHLRAALKVTTTEGAACPLAWVGREVTDGGQHLWVYLECPLPGGPAGARITQRVLRDTFPDQINSVRIRDHGRTPPRQVTLLFTGDAEQVVRFER